MLFSLDRVPTAPGKQGQTWKTWKNRGGVWAKTWKNITKPGKKFDLTVKKPKSLNKKKHLKKKSAQARGPRFFFVCLDKSFGIVSFCWNFKNIL